MVVKGTKAPVDTVDPVAVIDRITGLHGANIIRRLIKLLFSHVPKMGKPEFPGLKQQI